MAASKVADGSKVRGDRSGRATLDGRGEMGRKGMRGGLTVASCPATREVRERVEARVVKGMVFTMRK